MVIYKITIGKPNHSAQIVALQKGWQSSIVNYLIITNYISLSHCFLAIFWLWCLPGSDVIHIDLFSLTFYSISMCDILVHFAINVVADVRSPPHSATSSSQSLASAESNSWCKCLAPCCHRVVRWSLSHFAKNVYGPCLQQTPVKVRFSLWSFRSTGSHSVRLKRGHTVEELL